MTYLIIQLAIYCIISLKTMDEYKTWKYHSWFSLQCLLTLVFMVVRLIESKKIDENEDDYEWVRKRVRLYDTVRSLVYLADLLASIFLFDAFSLWGELSAELTAYTQLGFLTMYAFMCFWGGLIPIFVALDWAEILQIHYLQDVARGNEVEPERETDTRQGVQGYHDDNEAELSDMSNANNTQSRFPGLSRIPNFRRRTR